MVIGTDEEIAHLRQLRQITRSRQRELEKQAAKFGNHTPAEIALELRETEESIARLDAKMLLPIVPSNIQEATGPEASIDVLRMEVKNLREHINDAYRWMTQELLAIREESREYRASNDQDRRIWQRLNFGLLLLLVTLVLYEVARR